MLVHKIQCAGLCFGTMINSKDHKSPQTSVFSPEKIPGYRFSPAESVSALRTYLLSSISQPNSSWKACTPVCKHSQPSSNLGRCCFHAKIMTIPTLRPRRAHLDNIIESAVSENMLDTRTSPSSARSGSAKRHTRHADISSQDCNTATFPQKHVEASPW